MAWSREEQRAILAARDVLSQGGRIAVSSRSFWARQGAMAINTRREIVKAARELVRVGNEIEAGSITGSLAQALTDAGLPTTDEQGGLTGGREATVYGRIRYGDEEGGYTWRSFKLTLPWFGSIAQLESAVSGMVDKIGANYGLEGGVVESGSLVVY